jgi:glycosyltransferase involved in cell wall biosynthesis
LLPISHKKDIENVLKKNNYKKFFSGLGYGLRNVDIPKKTKFLPVVHGLRPVEMPLDKYEKYYAIDLKQKIIIIIKHLFSNYYFEYRKKNYFIFIKKYVNSLIVVSNHTKNSIISFYPKLNTNKIKILYSPEKLSNKVRPKKTNLKYILMISASVWIKNSYRGILALDDFFDNKKFRGIKAVILGGLPDKIFNKIRNKKNFEIHDYVSTKQLEEYYANAYLFFYPTLNEGFGYPPLEAMKYGTPVIASSISAVREVCEHSVLYFNPYSIEEMTTRLIQFQSIDYKRQKQKAIKQYSKIKKKQIKDLEKITKLILS